jgi:two-component system, OmpR family, alkaline phosphatase synthesis response regulator PhoP
MPKILIVDDSPTIVQLLKKGLEHDKNTILTTDNGIDALTLARKEIPDLIILDLMLPKLDGFHVCTMLKKDTSLNKIKVLVLTGRTDKGSENLGIECGADKYITKDKGPQEIIDIAMQLLSS